MHWEWTPWGICLMSAGMSNLELEVCTSSPEYEAQIWKDFYKTPFIFASRGKYNSSNLFDLFINCSADAWKRTGTKCSLAFARQFCENLSYQGSGYSTYNALHIKSKINMKKKTKKQYVFRSATLISISSIHIGRNLKKYVYVEWERNYFMNVSPHHFTS